MEQKEEAETLYNRQKEAVEDWAREARSRLHSGGRCPVCGQEIKALPSDQAFQSSLKPVYDNWQQKKQACELAEKAVHENDANLRSYQKLYNQKSAVVEQTRNRYQEQLRLTLQLCTAYSFTQLTVQELNFLKKHSEALDQERNSIRQKLLNIHQAEQELKNQQQEKDKMQKQLDNANRKLKTIETRLNECRIKEEAVRSFLKSQEQIIGDALEKLRSDMLWNDWEKQWEMNAEALMQRLQQASDAYRQIQENIVRLQKEVDNGTQLERSMEPFRESVQKAFPNWKDIPPIAPQQLPDLHEAWFRFASDCQSLRTVQDGLRESVRQQEAILLQFLERHPDFTHEYIQELAAYTTHQVEQLRNGQQQAREKAVSLEAAFRQTTGQLERHQADKPALEAEESIGTLTDKQQALDSQSTAIYQEIGQLENRENLPPMGTAEFPLRRRQRHQVPEHRPKLCTERTAERRQHLPAQTDRPLRVGLSGRFTHHPATRLLPGRKCPAYLYLVRWRKFPGIPVAGTGSLLPQPAPPFYRYAFHR